MDSNSNDAPMSQQRPPPEHEAGSGRQRTFTGYRRYAITVLAFDYIKIISLVVANATRDADDEVKLLSLWRVPALVALAYAVAAALIWFIGRLERQRLQRDDRDNTRWERWVKLAVEILVYAIVALLAFYSASIIPCALYVFM